MAAFLFIIIIKLSTEFVQNHYYLPHICSSISGRPSWVRLTFYAGASAPQRTGPFRDTNSLPKEGVHILLIGDSLVSVVVSPRKPGQKAVLHCPGIAQVPPRHHTTIILLEWKTPLQVAEAVRLLQIYSLLFYPIQYLGGPCVILQRKEKETAVLVTIGFLTRNLHLEGKHLFFIKMMRETHGRSIKWSRRGSVYNFYLQMDGKFRTVCKQADIYYILAMYLYLKQDFIALIQATSAPRSPSHHHQVTRS